MADALPESLVQWLFLDMDSFFASVEQHLRPDLRGRTVGIIPVESNGTCIIAASADAKQLGIRVGTSVREARELCPDIALIKARPDLYVQVHNKILESVDRCAPIHKVYSIDEWAIRLVGKERKAEQAIDLGRRIQQRMLNDFSPWLTCSIGIAPTRLLAKIASDLQKPNGIVTLHASDLPGRLEHLKLTDLPGIARGMLERLHNAQVQTVRQLWDLSVQDSRRIWGSVQGEDWWLGFHGHDVPEAPTQRSTISHANVLAPEHRNDHGAHAILVRLLCRGAARLRALDDVAHKLHISVSSYNDKHWSRELPLEGTQDTLTILRGFEALWSERPWAKSKREEAAWKPFSQVQMTLAGLTRVATTTPSLFAEENKMRGLSQAIDTINKRWGPHSVYVGSVHQHRHTMEDKIAFGRIPAK